MTDDLDLTGLSPDELARVLAEVRRRGTREAERAIDRDLDGPAVRRHRPDTLLPSVESEFDGLGSSPARVFFWTVHDSLLAEGMEAEVASRIPKRVGKVAMMCGLLGFLQRETAAEVGASVGTVKNDMARVRALHERGALEDAASRSLPPIPLKPEDWIRPRR